MNMRRFLSLIILIVLAALWLTKTDQPERLISGFSLTTDLQCQVKSVTDGDTLRCRDGTRIRLHAISTREKDNSCSPGHPCASVSAETSARALKTLVDGQTLACQTTGNSYNRVTAICWTPDQTEVNCHMVEKGYAALWDRYNDQQAICQNRARSWLSSVLSTGLRP